MLTKILIYRDSGANINFLKPYLQHIIVFQYPYDSPNRSKKQKMELATPSQLTWADAHSTWKESNFKWGDCRKSKIFPDITKIIGNGNKQDILHVDSAYKTGCNIFLTSDKADIWTKRLELEAIPNINFFSN